MKPLSKIGVVLAAIYAALFLSLFVKAIFWPHFDGAEWFGMYFLSLPVSGGIEALRSAGYFFDDKIIRVCTYAGGNIFFYYIIGSVIGRILRGQKKPNQ